jgi:hypothetical protein
MENCRRLDEMKKNGKFFNERDSSNQLRIPEFDFTAPREFPSILDVKGTRKIYWNLE